MKMFRNVGKRSARRGWPIMAYVGANGGGKSAAAVWDTLPTLAAGRPVLSTVRLLDYDNPRDCEGCDLPGHAAGHLQAHPGWVPFTEWTQLMEFTYGDVIMDEVTGVASSRESHSMPTMVANQLVQLRRRDVVLRWTAPSWARADKIIRECSQAVTYCRGRLPVKVKTGADEDDRQWRARRLFIWKTYDASDFEDFTSGKREALASQTSDMFWGPNSPAFAAYDTYDAVMSIGTVTDSGRCADCGGRRSAPQCSCSDYVHRKTRGRGAKEGPPKGDTAVDLPRVLREPLTVIEGG